MLWPARLLLLLAASAGRLAAVAAVPLTRHSQHLLSTELLSADHLPSFQPDPYPHLPLISFDEHGSFKLAVITDTHLLDGQNRSQILADKSTAAVKKYLKQEHPDYVVHLGDIVSGEDAHSTQDVEDAVVQILSPMRDAGVPFSTSKGNHDNMLYSTHGLITDFEHAHFSSLSYTRKAPPGVGSGRGAAQAGTGSDNYWVPVHGSASAGRGSRPELLLWFFDSRSGKTRKPFGNEVIEDWIDHSVAAWITHEVDGMLRAWGTVPPSIAFVHIPLHAAANSQQRAPYASQVGGVLDEMPKGYRAIPKRYPGLNDDKPFDGQGAEAPYKYEGQDRVAIDAFLQSAAGRSRIHAIVSGHQHGNDWCAPSSLRTASGQNVPLCQAKHSGFGGYDEVNWNHGTRLFRFSRHEVRDSMQTYIRFVTGEVRYATRIDDAWSAP